MRGGTKRKPKLVPISAVELLRHQLIGIAHLFAIVGTAERADLMEEMVTFIDRLNEAGLASLTTTGVQ